MISLCMLAEDFSRPVAQRASELLRRFSKRSDIPRIIANIRASKGPAISATVREDGSASLRSHLLEVSLQLQPGLDASRPLATAGSAIHTENTINRWLGTGRGLKIAATTRLTAQWES